MKKSKGFIILFITICVIIIVEKINHKHWNNEKKLYAIAYVKGYVAGNGPSRDKFSYTINGEQYFGRSYDLGQENYYIVALLRNEVQTHSIQIEIPINPNLLLPQPPEGWTECPINEDGTIKEKYKRSNDPWYLKKARYVVGEAMDTSMRYIYRFKWRYASVPNVEIGKHYMLKINADNLKQYELASTVPIDTAKLQIQTNGGWVECPVTKEGVIKDKFKK